MGQRVAGIGGIFFRSRDPKALAAWYAEHLGVDIDAASGSATFQGVDGTFTVWSPFAADTEYFESEQTFMVNYRVGDLDAMLSELREAGVRVADEREDSVSGRFGWAYDLEGRRFELWQPR